MSEQNSKSPLSKEALADIRAEVARLTSNFDCVWFDYPVDGLTITGYLIRPISKESGKLPVVIFNHGGNADIGGVREQYMFGKIFPLVEQGFIVIGSQYRGAGSSGRPSKDRLRDEFGGQDVNDVLALVPLIRAIPNADADRVGLWGWSRGGMMSFLAARKTSAFSAMVVGGAPTDIEAELAFRPEMEEVFRTWVPNYTNNRQQALSDRSVVKWAGELPSDLPILILHGADDNRVTPLSALKLATILQSLRRPYRLVIFEGGSHSLREHEAETLRETVYWFNKYLRSGSKPAQQAAELVR